MIRILLLSADLSRVLPSYIEFVVSPTGECCFELETDHHVPIALYCENELKHYGRRNCGSNLVLAY